MFLTEDLWFPDVTEADKDGLVAVRGDITTERLLPAYRSGIFPWFMEQDLGFWFSPLERFVLLPDEVHISHSMKQVMRKGDFSVTENHAVKAVIERCAAVNQWKAGSTWISEEFIESYTQLHHLGHAKSVEVWEGDSLVGGFYGVKVGNNFCGESMFSIRSNASKMALIHLGKTGPYKLIDCQVHTLHLESMGAKMIDRDVLIRQLKSTI